MGYSIITDDAFILSALPSGEDSRIIECFTHFYGRRCALAHAVRTEGARLRTGAVPYRCGRITLVVAHRNIVKDIQAIRVFQGVWESSARRAAYVSVLTALSRFTPEDESHPLLFKDMVKTVREIIRAPSALICAHWRDACIVHMGARLGYASVQPFTLEETVRAMIYSREKRTEVQTALEQMYSSSHL